MKKHSLLAVVATAALFLGATSLPTQALDLNRTIGSVTRTVDKTVDGVTRTVDTAVDTVTGTGNGTQAVSKSTKVTVLQPDSAANANARSRLLGGIHNRLWLLSHQRLAKLCLSIGGGKACGTGDQNRLVGTVTTRLNLLNNSQLAQVCVNVGSCGSGDRSGSGGGGRGSGGGGGPVPPVLANMSDHEALAFKRRCGPVMQYPQAYEDDIVKICRLIRQL